MEMNTENKLTLNGAFITVEQLKEEMSSLKDGEKIIEVAPGKYETLKRMQG